MGMEGQMNKRNKAKPLRDNDRVLDDRLEQAENFEQVIQFHPISTGDQLNYIADMILELREMTRSAGLETLSGILDIAHREAVHQEALQHGEKK